ncbi:hypothetical protein BDW02DRAFT_572790 [Decorospora gaudefroyi]|uniref:Zn(2)-C6 fungal-type domain-containing protein n=1 Tax=Decorospora gaudefroyi TaxID=184978 RepID=A0A6A5K055_9PLEO|nr:hypothetical protein BDW02DRAFT_572790 [Decorospora gaudefroyi]
MQPLKESRATTSCTECQRRKQKCSREWPCNHCQARKVPHLCQFSVKKVQQESPPESARESSSNDARGLKRSAPESAEPQFVSQDGDQEELEDGLKMWGYMPGHVHYKVGALEEPGQRKDSPTEGTASDAVEKILHVVPPRSIIDAFVNHFLSTVNYRYTAIYGPTLAEQYVQWWADRGAGKRLPPEFTCLLMRICAYSVQFLTPSLRKMIEFELACSSQTLTERFTAAAEQLSQNFSASNTCLLRVQEQLLKCFWLKSESKIVESWHVLGSTIRQAQELGMDKDAGIEVMSEFDIEMRRRLWTLLFVWDWQMSAWLGRPNLIDQKNLAFELPSLRLDQSTTDPRLLSPFAHMALQAQLGRTVVATIGDTHHVTEAKHILAIESACQGFIDGLPPIFRIENPDTSLDEAHPYFVFQRHQLHCVIFLTMLNIHKPYLTRERQDKMTSQEDEFRRKGVEIALRLLKKSRNLFDHEFPINAKFHMVVFCIFDTATLLCSAIIHDHDDDLPQREQVKDVIQSSLDMLHQLSQTTKLGATSYNFLYKLVQATPELAVNFPADKRQRQASPSVPAPATPAHKPAPAPAPATIAPPTTAPELLASEFDAHAPMTMTDDLSFDIDQFLAQNPFGSVGDPSALDMGGMEQIWDWDNLHLDGYTQQGWDAHGNTSG